MLTDEEIWSAMNGAIGVSHDRLEELVGYPCVLKFLSRELASRIAEKKIGFDFVAARVPRDMVPAWQVREYLEQITDKEIPFVYIREAKKKGGHQERITGDRNNPLIKKGHKALLVDIGTNGETVIGNHEWIVSSSASAGPALEGASLSCGMQAEMGAIESFSLENDEISYKTIGDSPPKGICGSGIIDLLKVLLEANVINRSGNFVENGARRFEEINGRRSYVLVKGDKTRTGKPIYVTESDIENIITAKAAIYAAMKILVKRLDMSFDDIDRFFIAGAFGNFIDIESAIAIGLIPNLRRDKINYAGNTSIKGAKIAALYKDAFLQIDDIRRKTTYYDLMGAHDYVDEFKKAMFIPHTDIDEFITLAH